MSSRPHLAIECSTTGGSVALLEMLESTDQQLLEQRILPHTGGSLQSLTPTIEHLLSAHGVRPGDLELISISHGPGSFTGLRVGLATAKMLAWAHKIPVSPVDTLAATALRFAQSRVAAARGPTAWRLVAAINAFRRQVFSSAWTISIDQPFELVPFQQSSVIDAAVWQSSPWPEEPSLCTEEQRWPLWITGAALDVYPLPTTDLLHLAPPDLWQPLAEQVAVLGLKAHLAGRSVPAAELMPNYIRASAAEEKSRPGR